MIGRKHTSPERKECVLKGGCGTCLVAVEEKVNNQRNVFAVNSCLVSIFSCHGWKIHTIEGIRGEDGTYHPIQKILAENNGTQCGFCSPGMVMNMFALHESGPITKLQLEDSFDCNLCRCTGYRPILTAFKTLASDADKESESIDIEDIRPCQTSKCLEKCEEKCKKAQEPGYFYNLRGSKWMKVYNLNDLLEVLRTLRNTNYMLVGETQQKEAVFFVLGAYRPITVPDAYIDITSVAELTTYLFQKDYLVLGGNIALNAAIAIFIRISKESSNFAYLAKVGNHINLVANLPVRNIGTIAGNLMLKHKHNDFPSDIFLLLETYEAVIFIVDTEGNETMTSAKDFLKVDMTKKVIKNIIFRSFDDSYKYVTYKIMMRAKNTHALVNAAGNIVQSARIIYGAINPSFVHATSTENYLIGKNLFDNNVLKSAYQALDRELKPDWVLPDPKPEFRKLLAISLFYKAVLNIAPSDMLSSRMKSGATILQRPVSSGTQEFGTNKTKYPVGEPIPKIEAYAQTSGEAEYIADMPDLPYQLFAAFVTAKAAPNSTILKVDATAALKVPGVVAFFDKSDIPGENTFMPPILLTPIKEEIFCSGIIQYYDQPVGLIVATNHDVAVNAAELVEVTYSAPLKKPLLTIHEVLDAKAIDKVHLTFTLLPKRKGTDIKHVVKGTFDLGLQYHFHMELQCCNVVPTEDSLDIYRPRNIWICHKPLLQRPYYFRPISK
ncbi:hypothetical protein NQ317_000045 [Molorchus minor]|uniref:FAD-binding PCMH-type domain-containing protein n=1 Tax=Molorchus minor TaxID=1323400 RepID=A0ABQ9IWF4_9CUCU|nr:hypothetical protein NQ317_000045 [Molorchus minor]